MWISFKAHAELVQPGSDASRLIVGRQSPVERVEKWSNGQNTLCVTRIWNLRYILALIVQQIVEVLYTAKVLQYYYSGVNYAEFDSTSMECLKNSYRSAARVH